MCGIRTFVVKLYDSTLMSFFANFMNPNFIISNYLLYVFSLQVCVYFTLRKCVLKSYSSRKLLYGKRVKIELNLKLAKRSLTKASYFLDIE